MTKPTVGSWLEFSGGTPAGVTCGTIGNFVLMSLASDEFIVRWCNIGDAETWATPATDAARAAQAGQEKLNIEYGFITGIVGNDFFGYVFQQRAITKFTYVGGDIVFRIDPFEVGRGCFDYNRFDRIDDVVFFQSEFGHHALENGQIVDIGHGLIDDSYPPVTSAEQKNVSINPAIQSVFFEDNNVCFNYKSAQWTRQPGLSGRNYYSIDSATGVVGQTAFSGQTVDFQDSAGGAIQTAILTTQEQDLNQGGRSLTKGVKPLVNGGTPTVRVGTRDDLSTSISWSTSTALTSRTGVADIRKEGRYTRTELTIPDTFNTALGHDIEFEPSGSV